MVALFYSTGRHLRLLPGDGCRPLWLAFLLVQFLILSPLLAAAAPADPAPDGQGKPASAVAFSPAGETIVTGNKDGVLMLWNRQTGKLDRQFKSETAGISMMASSPAAESLAVGTADGTIELWDLEKGRCRKTLRGHEATVTALAFTEDGELLASGSDDRTIKLWQVQTGKLLKSTREGRSAIRALAFSPDGQVLASDGDDQNVRLWKVQTGDLLNTLKGHGAPVAGVAISADGELLASSSAEGLLIWNLKKRQTSPIGVEGAARMLAFSPRPHVSFLAAATDDEIWLWNVEQERRAGALKGHTGKIRTIAFSPDGKQIVSLGSDNNVRLWSLRPNEALLVINTATSEARAPSASATPPASAAGSSSGRVETAWPLASKEPPKAPAPAPAAAPARSLSLPAPGGSPQPSTISAPPSQLRVTQVILDDPEKGSRSPSRDRVDVSVVVVNPGPGTVSKARAKLNFGPGVASAAGSPEEFDLEEMAPDAAKVMKFSCMLSSAIKSGSPIPISVIFTTEFDVFAKEQPLNLVMNAPGSPPQVMEPVKPARNPPPPPKPALSDEQRKVLAKEYYEKGNVAFEAREYEDAAASYAKAIELEDGFAPLFYNLGMTQRALHRNKEAISNFKRYLVLRPDAPNASEVMQMIEVLGE